MTDVNIKFIIKTINGSSILLILENECIPSSRLSNLHPDINHTLDNIAKIYNIHNAYINPKLVDVIVENNVVNIYYTTLVPLEFISETDTGKISNNFSKLPECDRIAIRQAISVFSY